MANLVGAWTIATLPKGTARVLLDGSPLILRENPSTITFTRVGSTDPETRGLDEHTETSFALDSDLTIQGKVTTGVEDDKVLAGFSKNETAVESFAAHHLDEENGLHIKDGRYLLTTLIHEGNGFLKDQTQILITTNGHILAIAHGESGSAHIMTAGAVSHRLDATSIDDPKVTLSLLGIDRKAGPLHDFILVGHVAQINPVPGPDDADSFVAIRVGPGGYDGGEEGGD